MSTREDLKQFYALNIGHDTLGLIPPCGADAAYFCTPAGAEFAGRLGADGIHFVLLPGDETVYCADPSTGDVGTYVLPVAADFREFLSFVLFCRDAGLLAQIAWLDEARFRRLLAEDAAARWEGCEPFLAEKTAALEAVAAAFRLEPKDPYARVKALQSAFDPARLTFSGAYYDTLGLAPPKGRKTQPGPGEFQPVCFRSQREEDW